MRLFTNLIVVSAVILAVSAQAIDQDVQVDILIKKIQFASKEHRYKDLVVEMDKFKKLSNSLNQPLSDNFQYMYVDALERTGDYAGVIQYANGYMESFGKKGAHYDDIIEKIAKYEDTVNKEALIKKMQADKAIKEKEEKEKTDYVTFDKSTGLTWQDYIPIKAVKMNWQEAMDFCENLTLARRSDWRLPTNDELLVIYSDEDRDFIHVISYYYWTSSSAVDDSNKAWSVSYYDGNARNDDKVNLYYVRCVSDSK